MSGVSAHRVEIEVEVANDLEVSEGEGRNDALVASPDTWMGAVILSIIVVVVVVDSITITVNLSACLRTALRINILQFSLFVISLRLSYLYLAFQPTTRGLVPLTFSNGIPSGAQCVTSMYSLAFSMTLSNEHLAEYVCHNTRYTANAAVVELASHEHSPSQDLSKCITACFVR